MPERLARRYTTVKHLAAEAEALANMIDDADDSLLTPEELQSELNKIVDAALVVHTAAMQLRDNHRAYHDLK